MSQIVATAEQAEVEPASWFLRLADVVAKSALVILLAAALVDPASGNMQDKAGGLRAVAYPLLSFTIPALWWALWRDRVAFPWLADVMVTITCFTDILGNRLDLYDSTWWFDDWMHFMNNGLLAGAVILLTLPRGASLGALVERALAFGASAAIAWEIGEYFAFISNHSSEREFAYADTLGDLGLGTFGSLVAALVIWGCWRAGALRGVEPVTSRRARPPARRG
jgi:hypothetical protein